MNLPSAFRDATPCDGCVNDGRTESTTALASTFTTNALSPGVTAPSSTARGLRLTAPIVKVTGAEAVPLLPSEMVYNRQLSVMPRRWRDVRMMPGTTYLPPCHRRWPAPSQPPNLTLVTSRSSTACGGPFTVMMTRAVTNTSLPSVIVYVNVSLPAYPALGVYVIVPSAFSDATPSEGVCTMLRTTCLHPGHCRWPAHPEPPEYKHWSRHGHPPLVEGT